MVEEFKSCELKEAIRTGLSNIQSMAPGTTANFFTTRRHHYFPDIVTEKDIVAFFNNGHVEGDAGLDSDTLRHKVLEAAIASLLDRAFEDEAVLPVIATNVRAELTRIIQADLGLQMVLDFVDAPRLSQKVALDLEARGSARLARWKQAQASVRQAERKSHGGNKIIYKTTMRGIRGDSTFNRVGYIEEGTGGGGQGNKEVLTRLDGISSQLNAMNRQLGDKVSVGQLRSAFGELEGRVGCTISKRLKMERGHTDNLFSGLSLRLEAVEAALRERGICPLVDLTLDQTPLKTETLVDDTYEEEDEDEAFKGY